MQLPELQPAAVAAPTERGVEFRFARTKDADAIAAIYESVFGKGGIKAAGHEQYPEPDVFTPHGVVRIAQDPERRFIVAEMDNRIVGGMIINFISPYNCEFACVCVGKKFQGLGISPLMLAHARRLADQSPLTINSTEIVTHSVLSQTAHNSAGYSKVTGFGFCQYPRVFFLNHPESCIWISDLSGRVARCLLIDKFGLHGEQFFSAGERILLDAIGQSRDVFLPHEYRQIVTAIANQFADQITYRIHAHTDMPSAAACDGQAVQMELHDVAPYAYIKFPSGSYDGWHVDVNSALGEIAQAGKRFIQARIPANKPSAVVYAQYLRERGFVLLGFLPLYSYHDRAIGKPYFDDLLVLQWIAPEVIASNELPGETDSVIKLYGYPDNLTGALLKVIRKELAGNPLVCGLAQG